MGRKKTEHSGIVFKGMIKHIWVLQVSKPFQANLGLSFSTFLSIYKWRQFSKRQSQTPQTTQFSTNDPIHRPETRRSGPLYWGQCEDQTGAGQTKKDPERGEGAVARLDPQLRHPQFRHRLLPALHPLVQLPRKIGEARALLPPVRPPRLQQALPQPFRQLQVHAKSDLTQQSARRCRRSRDSRLQFQVYQCAGPEQQPHRSGGSPHGGRGRLELPQKFELRIK